MKKTRIKIQIHPAIEEALRGVPSTNNIEWCKREAQRWPFPITLEFMAYSARMYYEAVKWAEQHTEENQRGGY